ncbi:MAG TPA: chorismate synthase, partial [Thermodesulfobacteriota bacterium]|nr:chorismate synthase [Thermodesulfobacteriota bacterium]
FLTAGESHGLSLTVIVEGMPADILLSADDIDRDLLRRQIGYGRGKRMEIERDQVQITAGVRWGRTLGSPISLVVANKDWVNWQTTMSAAEADADESRVVRAPRQGHADLAGALKYHQYDIRTILERASARETAARVAAGGVFKALLRSVGISIFSYTTKIGKIVAEYAGLELSEVVARAEESPLRCPDGAAATRMKACIDEAREQGNTLGGVVEIVATGIPPGLGSHVHWDRKLDGRIAQSLMSIQGVKGVEVGMGFGCTDCFGSQVHDEIFYSPSASGKSPWGFFRKTNNAGGIEGGMTNGEPIVVRCAMKPIATLMKPLRSVDLSTKKPQEAAVERSDVCRVPSLGVIAEAAVAYEIARAFMEKFGGDSRDEILARYALYRETLEGF